MEHLSNVFTKNPDVIDELFKQHVSITLKIDGMAFQIVYNDETSEIEYHKRGGDASKVGPLIDDFSKLLVKKYTATIKDFDSKKDLLDDYKFLAVEIFDKKYVLLTVVTKDNKVIDKPDSLKSIADKLKIDTVPVLLEGKLTDVQKDGLKTMMTLGPETTNEEYKKYLTDLFGDKEYTEFLKGSGEIEGIVLTFVLDGKVAQYKIINPAFKTRHDAELKQQREEQLKLAGLVEQILTLFINKLSDAEKLDDKKLYSLDKNFLKLMQDSKFANKVMNVAAKFPPETNPLLGLDLVICSPEMKKFLKRLGKTMEAAYKQFVMAFYKTRKRNYIVSKEFQMKINEISDKM